MANLKDMEGPVKFDKGVELYYDPKKDMFYDEKKKKYVKEKDILKLPTRKPPLPIQKTFNRWGLWWPFFRRPCFKGKLVKRKMEQC